MSPVRRRFFHRRIARALEELHAGDLESVSLHLAAHYDEAGMPNEAISNYRQAATVAQQRFADKEAAGMLTASDCTRAACFRSPPKRDELELELLVTLGPKLVATLGYAHAGSRGDVPSGARIVAQPSERKSISLSSSAARGCFTSFGANSIHRGNLAQQLMDFAARRTESRAALPPAILRWAAVCSILGELTLSHEQMARTISMYGKVSHAALALFAGPDVGVFCRSYLAHLLWHQGYPDQALAAIQDAIRAASRIGYPFSMAIALTYAALLCRSGGKAKRRSSMREMRSRCAESRISRTTGPSPKLSRAGRRQSSRIRRQGWRSCAAGWRC